MERWSLDRYRRPALLKREVNLVGERTVSIGSGEDAVDLAIDGIAGAEVAEIVGQLMDPVSDVWMQMKVDASLAWVHELAAQLDGLSLIEETDVGTDEMSRGLEWATHLCTRVARRLAAVIQNRMPRYIETLTTVSGIINRVNDADSARGGAQEAFPHPDNFALQAIHFQLVYARGNTPEIIAAWQRVLAETFHLVQWWPDSDRPHQDDTTAISLQDLPPGVTAIDPIDLEAYLLSFVHFIEIAPLRVGKRMTAVDAIDCSGPCSGLALASRTERMLLRALDRLGASAYATAMLAAKPGITPLVQGLYIEQYHVTNRFVEIIAPLLTKRLARGIRSRLFRYFQEEYGHEAYELATCVALGVDETDVRHSVPLPLTNLYVDVYTVVARQMSTAFFSALMVTEGLLDQQSPVHAHLAKLVESVVHAGDTASRHSDVNDELNHASLSRLFLADVPFVSPSEQRYSLEVALFMLEVNFRQLEAVAMYYGDQPQLRFHGLE